MYSSHSAMPIFSPDEVVVFSVFVVVPLFELSMAVLLLPISVLLQPTRIAAQRTHITKIKFLYIGITPSGSVCFLNRKQSRLEKRRYHTRALLEIKNILDGSRFLIAVRQEFVRLNDFSRDCRGRHHIRRGEIELAGTAATGKVSVLGADGHRLSGLRRAGAGVDARA